MGLINGINKIVPLVKEITLYHLRIHQTSDSIDAPYIECLHFPIRKVGSNYLDTSILKILQ